MIKQFLAMIGRLLWRIVRGLVWLVWAIMRPSMRFITAVLLLASVIALTTDVTRWQVGEAGPMFQSLGYHVQTVAPASFKGLEQGVSATLHPVVWNYVLVPFFAIPAWLIFAVFAIAIAYAGREPKRINVFIN